MKDDLDAIAVLVSWIGFIIFMTLVFVGIAQWLSGMAYRMGLQSSEAQWTIYAMGLLLCIGVSLSILSRIVEGKWWWK